MLHKVIVVGALNTDIIASGVPILAGPGGYAKAEQIHFGPGGKSRNIAQMIGLLHDKPLVAMVSKTTADTMGLWKIPIESLTQAGVDTRYVINDGNTSDMPDIALIAVDVKGNNQIYVASNVSKTISVADINKASSLFAEVGQERGFLVATLEFPALALRHSLKLAQEHGLRVLLDPGGIADRAELKNLIDYPIFLLKPNEHEAALLSGVKITSLATAKKAATTIKNDYKVENILITAGSNGAYLFTDDEEVHLPVPTIDSQSDAKDETGCGDQTMAGITSALVNGSNLLEACLFGVKLGTMQFHRLGIEPILAKELLNAYEAADKN